MAKRIATLAFLLFGSAILAQNTATKYPWQFKGTNCTEGLSFCWYGSEIVGDPEVTAFGFRWVAQDKEEKPLEWVTAVRCVRPLRVCVLARDEKALGGGSMNSIHFYAIKEWTEYQIRAIGESDHPSGKECEIDSLLLNREEASVSVLSVPGPAANTKGCQLLMKPKTVMFRLELGLKPQRNTPQGAE